MTAFYVDTSAIAKRYLPEIGFTWVRQWIDPSTDNLIIIADLTPVEMFSLLARRLREKSIFRDDLLVAQTEFLIHVEKEYLTIPLDSHVLGQAQIFINRYPLRTLDAIQLGAAWWARSVLEETMTFVSADNNLLSAALAEGFSTDNPFLHP